MSELADGSGPDRPVTRARRNFGAAEIAALPADQIRKFCHILLLADGLTVSAYSHVDDYDEFTVTSSPLWRQRESVLRVYHRAVNNADLADLVEHAKYITAAETAVVAAFGAENDLVIPAEVHLISQSYFANLISRTPLIEWQHENPTPAAERLSFINDLAERASLLDPVGIMWLPQLALNELPHVYPDQEASPQDLFERKAFRLLTATFRFGGHRYGELYRGKRFPDAVLHWPDRSPVAALVDCKAASHGYRMDADDMLRFQEYWERLHQEVQHEGRTLQYLVILSSFFPGPDGDRHPYYGRKDEVLERTGLHLVYMTASDLAWSAAHVEANELSIHLREAIDWHRVFEAGLVEALDLDEAIASVTS